MVMVVLLAFGKGSFVMLSLFHTTILSKKMLGEIGILSSGVLLRSRDGIDIIKTDKLATSSMIQWVECLIFVGWIWSKYNLLKTEWHFFAMEFLKKISSKLII